MKIQPSQKENSPDHKMNDTKQVIHQSQLPVQLQQKEKINNSKHKIEYSQSNVKLTTPILPITLSQPLFVYPSYISLICSIAFVINILFIRIIIMRYSKRSSIDFSDRHFQQGAKEEPRYLVLKTQTSLCLCLLLACFQLTKQTAKEAKVHWLFPIHTEYKRDLYTKVQ